MSGTPTVAAELLERLGRWGGRLAVGRVVTTVLGLALGLESVELLVLGLIPVLLWPWARRRRLQATTGLEAAAALAGVAVGVPLGLRQGASAPGIAAFLLVAQALKLLAPRGPRDEGTVVVVGVVLMAVAASEAVSPLFGLLLLLNVACVFLGLAARTTAALVGAGPVALSVRRDGAPAAMPIPGPRALLPARALAVVGLASAALFVSMPRVGAHLLPTERDARDRLSGFTDLVGLGDIGRIQQSDQVAFRAELVSGTLPATPYWKGRALDEYDAQHQWKATRRFIQAGQRLDYHPDDPMTLQDLNVLAPQGTPAEVVVYLEPLGTRCLFTVGAVQRIAFKSARPEIVDRDLMGAVLCLRPPSQPLAYRLVTHPSAEVPVFRMGRDQAQRLERACLQLPAEVDAERLRAYALDVLRRRGLEPGRAAASAVCAALEDHLATTLSYTLDAQQTPGVEPVADFLFNRRAGHCEYFASTLVILLRTLGIPARLVSGFRGGEVNTWSQTWTVRQRDAHAWVEARTETTWQRYDPTPLDEGAGASSGWADSMRIGLDWLELKWLQWVIAFDAYDQRLLLRDAQRWLAARLAQALLVADELEARPGPTAAGALGVVALAGAAWAALRRRRRGGATSAAPVEAEVAQVLALLARRGVVRSADETLGEVVARAQATLGAAAAPLGPWAARRNARRWGGGGPDPAEAAATASALESLRA